MPAIAVYQSQICWLTHRNREQARSHIWLLIWSEIDHRASSPLLPCPAAIPQQLIHKATHSNCAQLPFALEIKPRKSVTYSKHRFLSNIDQFLIISLKTTFYMASRGSQTPYPQKRQQTLGATLAVLWKTVCNRAKSRLYARKAIEMATLIIFQPTHYKPLSTWPVADSEHLIHRSTNRLWGQLWPGLFPYPQKKPSKNRRLGWLFFVQRATGLDLHGVWTAANRLSTGGLTGIVGNTVNPVGAGLPAMASPGCN